MEWRIYFANHMVVLYSLIRQVYVSSIKHYSEQRFFILLYYLLPGELRDFQLALAKTPGFVLLNEKKPRAP